MLKLPSPTANHLASKIFTQLQQNQLLRLHLRKCKSYITQSQIDLRKFVKKQESTIQILTRQISKKSHKIGKERNHQFSWESEYVKLVNVLQTFSANIGMLIHQFEERDLSKRQEIDIVGKELEDTQKMYHEFSSTNSKIYEDYSQTICQAQTVIESIMSKNYKLNSSVSFQQKLITELQYRVRTLQSQKEQLRQEISIVCQNNQELKNQRGSLKERLEKETENSFHLKKQVQYFDGVEDIRKKKKGCQKGIQVQEALTKMEKECQTLKREKQKLSQTNLDHINVLQRQQKELEEANRALQISSEQRVKQTQRLIQLQRGLQNEKVIKNELQKRSLQHENMVASLNSQISSLKIQIQCLKQSLTMCTHSKQQLIAQCRGRQKELVDKDILISKYLQEMHWKEQQIQLKQEGFKQNNKLLQQELEYYKNQLKEKQKRLNQVEDRLIKGLQQLSKQHCENSKEVNTIKTDLRQVLGQQSTSIGNVKRNNQQTSARQLKSNANMTQDGTADQENTHNKQKRQKFTLNSFQNRLNETCKFNGRKN